MARDNGGIIGPVNDPTNTTASGVWSLEEQYQAQLAGNWPSAPAPFSTNSLRFDDGSTDYLDRTPASEGTTTTWTFSCWTKKSTNETYQTLLAGNSSTTNNTGFFFNDTDELQFWNEISSTVNINIRTTAKFRDPSAWYHVILSFDSTQATQSDRLKIYVNGVEQDLTISTNVSLNQVTWINDDIVQKIGGQWGQTGTSYFDGYMSEVILVDGQQLDETSFGVSDANGVWTPITYIGTFGTNGFQLQFGNSAALGTDSSPNGNNFTVNNLTSIDQTTDYPVNNFSTMNSLYRSRQANDGVFSEGNTKLTYTASDANKGTILSTLGVNSGKWYWEVKALTGSREMIGVGYNNVGDTTGAFHDSSPSNGFSVFAGNGNLYYDNTNTSYGSSFTANDIIMVALDMDNYLCWLGKNGTWFNSATQTEIENGTATNDATTAMGTQQNLNNGDEVFALFADTSATGQASFQSNFGNPPFTISSGNSDAEGYGNFEYAVPSGYYALCTKNLAEYG